MATQLIRVEALDRSTPLPGPPTKSGYIRLRVSNDPSPGIARDVVSPVVPPRAVKELSAMDSLMGGQKNKSVVDKAAMYALPPGTKLSALDTVLTGGFRAGGSSARALTSSETIPRTKSAPTGTVKRPRSGDNDDEEDDEEESGKRISPSRSAPVKRASTGQGRILPPLPPGQHPYDPVVIPFIPFVAPEFDPIIIPAGTFKIILIVDTREVTGSKQDKDGFLKLLTKQGIHAEKRMLPLGDMIWVARRNDDETGKQDIMLDAIVERKRLDDLAMSIKDGRYADQKVNQSFSLSSSFVTILC
jgi:crossover junction endonuclease MUS81